MQRPGMPGPSSGPRTGPQASSREFSRSSWLATLPVAYDDPGNTVVQFLEQETGRARVSKSAGLSREVSRVDREKVLATIQARPNSSGCCNRNCLRMERDSNKDFVVDEILLYRQCLVHRNREGQRDFLHPIFLSGLASPVLGPSDDDRHVFLVDESKTRNACSYSVHGFNGGRPICW
jgi:hypothetical protein